MTDDAVADELEIAFQLVGRKCFNDVILYAVAHQQKCSRADQHRCDGLQFFAVKPFELMGELAAAERAGVARHHAVHMAVIGGGREHFRFGQDAIHIAVRSEEHTSELQSLMRISYAVFCLKKKNMKKTPKHST